MTIRFLPLSAPLAGCLVLGCSTPSASVVEAWKHSFGETILPGASDFHGLFVDSDNGVFIFGYRPPKTLPNADVLPHVRSQLSCREIIFTSTELQLRCLKAKPRWPDAFDEYRFLFDPERRLVTVMFVEVDSPDRMAVYDADARSLRCLHRPEGLPLFGSCP